MTFFENNQKTETRKTLDPNKIYLYNYYTYNQIMEEKYATKIQLVKSKLYGECNIGVSAIKRKGELGTLDTWINP